jgi:hypothetical protein
MTLPWLSINGGQFLCLKLSSNSYNTDEAGTEEPNCAGDGYRRSSVIPRSITWIYSTTTALESPRTLNAC